MSKHTQGLWVELHDFDGDFGIFAGHKLLAVTVSDTDEDAANARLMAAAPQILEALKRSQKIVGGYIDICKLKGLEHAAAVVAAELNNAAIQSAEVE